MDNKSRRCGGTVGLESTALTSLRFSTLAFGACSRRSCSSLSVTVFEDEAAELPLGDSEEGVEEDCEYLEPSLVRFW